MSIVIRMPDESLAPFVDTYGRWPASPLTLGTFAPGLIAFNLSDAHLEVNGERRTEPVLMGIANDPVTIEYKIASGEMFSIRCFTGSFDRLFDIDPSKDRGLIPMDAARHPKIARIYERVRQAAPDHASRFAAFDEALMELVPEAKSSGLVGRFVKLVNETDPFLSVAEICERLGCTPRTLERACKRRFGRTPKRLLMGQRLNKTRQVEAKSEGRVELSPDFAYADLPHYLNDLRRITGQSRKQLEEQSRINESFDHRYEWPDGQAVESDEELEAWRTELRSRYENYTA